MGSATQDSNSGSGSAGAQSQPRGEQLRVDLEQQIALGGVLDTLGHHRKPHYTRCRHDDKAYRHLARGKYTFYVRAFNSAGTDHTPARRRFRI